MRGGKENSPDFKGDIRSKNGTPVHNPHLGILNRQTDNPQLSRAEAFQHAMREIRNDKSADSDVDTWAHPSAWAPFSLIGDGAK